MDIPLRTYLDSLKEKITYFQNKKENPDDSLEDINVLMDIIEHLIRTTDPKMSEVKEFVGYKRSFEKFNKILTNSDRNKELKPFFHKNLTNRNKNFDMDDLPERVQELVCLNDCINSAVSYQSNLVDNFTLQMNKEEEIVDYQNNELEIALRHRKRKNRIYNWILFIIGFLFFMILTVRIILR